MKIRPKQNNPTKVQHYLPCAYLQFFSLNPKGKKSLLHVFNGYSSKERTAKSVGYSEYTYSKADPETAEGHFKRYYEDDYPAIAKKIIAGKRLTLYEKTYLFFFAIQLKCRSPSYKISTGEERYAAFNDMMGSICNEIEPITDEDRNPNNRYHQRILSRFRLRIVKSRLRIFISDNPVVLYSYKSIFGIMVLLPISPTLFAVFYQHEFLECKGNASDEDIKHLMVSQRQSRMSRLFYPVSLKFLCRDDIPLPAAAENLSEVTKGKIVHHFSHLEGIYDFIAFK